MNSMSSLLRVIVAKIFSTSLGIIPVFSVLLGLILTSHVETDLCSPRSSHLPSLSMFYHFLFVHNCDMYKLRPWRICDENHSKYANTVPLNPFMTSSVTPVTLCSNTCFCVSPGWNTLSNVYSVPAIFSASGGR